MPRTKLDDLNPVKLRREWGARVERAIKDDSVAHRYTMQSLCERAGISKPTLYRVFAGDSITLDNVSAIFAGTHLTEAEVGKLIKERGRL